MSNSARAKARRTKRSRMTKHQKREQSGHKQNRERNDIGAMARARLGG